MVNEQPSYNMLFNIRKAEFLSIPTKTVLLEEGKIANRIYLIRKGCMRLFFNDEGKDITFQFFFEGDFVASFDSLYNGKPSSL
ncbi:cyclic nucleotide-binding domain-containing protein [Bacteroides sp.]|uniref:Crp/Fnr family transcriptional regulator n=1 Tax=Bacteroides sp. TaxID=29523 RepID=UPI0025BE00E3|nr:cyclic nucleotide-binding domain-containing protein [Bacteroides sp.]